MARTLLPHWPEYLIEGVLLGTFLLAACLGAFVLEHPASPVHRAVASPAARRAVMGLLMGLTAVALIYSPPGARSGAHMNPATTLTFLALGKIAPVDAGFYVAAQCVGGVAGVVLAGAILGRARIAHQSVNYAVTAPGARGRGVAWAVEFILSFLMMAAILIASNSPKIAPHTGLLAGGLVALFVFLGAPLSGMSINPARTLGSALPARAYRGLWIYFTAPPLAMLAAGMLYVLAAGPGNVYCAKLNHAGDQPCLFRCQIDQILHGSVTPPQPTGIKPPGTPATTPP